MSESLSENDKVLDLVDFVHEHEAVTVQEVSQAFGLEGVHAAAVLESLPFDSGSGCGVYTIPDQVTVDAFLEKIDDPDQKIKDRIASAPFEDRVLMELADTALQLAKANELLEKMMEMITSADNAPKIRRRRRGELFAPNPCDTEELAKMRRDGYVEVEKAKATGDKAEYDKVYARWNQRIDNREKKLGIGRYSQAEQLAAHVEDTQAAE